MNETYWAIKRREWASREQRATRRTRRSVPLRRPAPPAPIPAEVLEETAADILETDYGDQDAIARANSELSYRDLQAQAKELDIPANQSADDLKEAIEKAG